MKKSLIALAALGAFAGTAFAASSVTLYGVIDTSAVVTKAKHQDTLVQMKSGFRNGSRWGIKGIEDLGNGYAVGFILEQGFNSNNGTDQTAGSQFSRESKIYFQGPFGQIGFGRLGSLAGGAQSNSILTGWALGTSYTQGSWTNLAINSGTRLSNAVAYVSPKFAGFQLSLEYSNGISSDTNEWSKNNHYYGIGATYEFGGFKNSLVFEMLDNDGETGDDRANQYLINLGLGYKFGAVTPMFAYQYHWQDDGIKDNIFGLSAAIQAGGGTAKVGVRYLFGKNEAPDTLGNSEDKRRAFTINAAYEYPLSKRTTLWGYAGWATGAKTLGADHINHRPSSTEYKNAVYYNGYQLALGVTHNF